MKRVLAILAVASSCAALKPKPAEVVRLAPVEVKGDLELEKLNDKELFAQGQAAYAANEWRQAARYFDRLVDFHPTSANLRAAQYNAGLAA